MMTALMADISSGNTAFADVMFLVGLILFLGAAAIAWAITPRALWATVASLGLAAVALGWLVL